MTAENKLRAEGYVKHRRANAPVGREIVWLKNGLDENGNHWHDTSLTPVVDELPNPKRHLLPTDGPCISDAWN